MGRDTHNAAFADAVDRLSMWLRRTVPMAISASAITTLDTLDTGGQMRVSDLAARESVSQPGMTGLVNRLEAAGYAERVADPDDGRAALVRITDAGRSVLAQRRDARAGLLTGRLAALDPDDRATLAAAVPVIVKLMNLTNEKEPVTTR